GALGNSRGGTLGSAERKCRRHFPFFFRRLSQRCSLPCARLHNGAFTTPVCRSPSPRGFLALHASLTKRPDTVGELKSAEMCVSHMPSLKAKKRGKLAQRKVLLEP